MENTLITFTPLELFHAILAICGAITAIAAAAAVIVTIVKKAKAPNEMQNSRIDQLEERIDNHDTLFDSDNKRLKDIEQGNRVMQQALLALLSHGIDGDDVESLRKAKEVLHQYLIER